MNITKFSIRRPIGISMIFMLITVLGLFSYSHIGVELLPDVESLGKKYNGKITFVSPDKNRENKNYMVRVSLNKSDEQLKSGMFARG
ncbi:MAG: hypothetical protein J6F33_00190, partial [Acidaminococcaceae bacterium]|nr:hypothetical protein [Acidaminococcaceae bacterium]